MGLWSRDYSANCYSRRGNFGGSVFTVCYGRTIHPTTKVSEEVNRKYPARNTLVQLSTPTPTLSATIHSVTERQTARWHYDATSGTVWSDTNRL